MEMGWNGNSGCIMGRSFTYTVGRSFRMSDNTMATIVGVVTVVSPVIGLIGGGILTLLNH